MAALESGLVRAVEYEDGCYGGAEKTDKAIEQQPGRRVVSTYTKMIII